MGLAVDKGPSIVLALPWGSRHILEEEKPGLWALTGLGRSGGRAEDVALGAVRDHGQEEAGQCSG